MIVAFCFLVDAAGASGSLTCSGYLQSLYQREFMYIEKRESEHAAEKNDKIF